VTREPCEHCGGMPARSGSSPSGLGPYIEHATVGLASGPADPSSSWWPARACTGAGSVLGKRKALGEELGRVTHFEYRVLADAEEDIRRVLGAEELLEELGGARAEVRELLESAPGDTISTGRRNTGGRPPV
jgi:hypothetical protein